MGNFIYFFSLEQHMMVFLMAESIDFSGFQGMGEEAKTSCFSAINDKQIQVTFNKAIKNTSVITTPGTADTLKAGVFTLARVDGAVNASALTALADGTTAAALSADGKTLTLTDVDAAKYYAGTYAFVTLADKVETTTNEKIAKTTSTFTINDVTRPTITGVEYPNSVTARVLFSEPVIKGLSGTVSFKNAAGEVITTPTTTGTVTNDGVNNKYYITVDLSAAGVPVNANITTTVIGYQDFAGNIISPNPTTVLVKKDTTDITAPTLVSATATSGTTADVLFSKALDDSTIATAITADHIQVGVTTVSTFKVDASNPALYHATFTAQTGLVTFTITTGEVKDKAGNSLATSTKLLNFNTDVAGPTVVSTTLTKVDGVESLIVTFNENVAVQDAKAITTSRVKDYVTTTPTLTTTTTADAVANNVNAALYNAVDGKSSSISISLANVADGQYTAKLPTGLVKDLFGNNSSEKANVTFTRTIDNTTGKPALIAVTPIVQGADNNKITIKFDKKLDPATALVASNYIVEGATVESAALIANAAADAQVSLTLATGSNGFTGVHVFTISGVTSDAGVMMDSVTTSATINENVAPTVTKAELTTATNIKVTFSEAVYNTVAGAGTDFDLYIGGVKSSKTVEFATVAIGAASTSLNGTVSAALTAEELAAGVTIKATSTQDIKDVVNNLASIPSAITVQ